MSIDQLELLQCGLVTEVEQLVHIEEDGEQEVMAPELHLPDLPSYSLKK